MGNSKIYLVKTVAKCSFVVGAGWTAEWAAIAVHLAARFVFRGHLDGSLDGSSRSFYRSFCVLGPFGRLFGRL